MIKILVLKNPNIDVIADVEVSDSKIELCNVFVCSWIQEYCKFIPFQAAKDLSITLNNSSNIAMEFEASDDMQKLYEKHVKNYYKNPKQFQLLDKEEYDAKIASRKEEVAKIVSRNKKN